MVDPLEWDLTAMPDKARRDRLMNPPSPERLIEIVATEALAAAAAMRAWLIWEQGLDMKDCSRAVDVFPVSSATFDLLFNGRSGYRAQFYLSVEEGAAFNRFLVSAMLEAARVTYPTANLPKPWPTVRKSLDGPWSKFWIFKDSKAFQNAPKNEFQPRRWRQRRADGIGLRAPLPDKTAIDFKGTWLTDAGDEFRQDIEYKGDRDLRIHEGGHA